MRVLHFYKTYKTDSIGGVEQVICQLCSKASEYGIAAEVLSLSPSPGEMEIDGYRVHRAKLDFQLASTSFSWSVIRRFDELARQADVIHYHFPWPYMDIVHFATRIRKPTVLTYHSDIVRQRLLLHVYRPLMNRFLASVDHIVATSPNYLATSDVLEQYAAKVSVIPIGLDRATYPVASREKIEKWRNRFGDRFFLFVGVLRYYKGLHILLEAAHTTNYPIVIIGGGPIEKELKKQAASLQLNNVHFLGKLPEEDKVALLTLCYGVVFPSHLRSEAFGISLLEGAMYGKPMISSEIGTGTSYVNINGETGVVVPPSDPAAFREAMQFLWDNPAVAARMGAWAERRYWDLFTADRMAVNYARLYAELKSRSHVPEIS